jgi:choice-of-anchor A domain-containing protein
MSFLRWIVGRDRDQATPRKRRTGLKLEQLESRAVPSATDLGGAQGYNAFVFNNYKGFNSDSQAPVAVGDNATLTNYGVAQSGVNYGGSDSLVVGNNLNYTNGEVFSGNAVYGNNGTLTNVYFGNGHAQQQSGVVNFSSVQSDLDSKSTTWGTTYATNGTISNNYGNLTLTGTNSTIDIFNLTASQLGGIYSVSINAPAGATVLINVSGTTVNLQNLGISIQGTSKADVLWNFYQAKTVNISGVSVQGSILAPLAQVNFNNGSIYGTLVAYNLCGNGQLDYCQVSIEIPTSVPGTISGRVYNDTTGDPGLSGVEVYLVGTKTGGGSYSASTTTGNNGYYEFDNVPPGTYTIAVGTLNNTWTTVVIQVGSQGGTSNLGRSEILNIPVENATDGTGNNFGQQQNGSGAGGD